MKNYWLLPHGFKTVGWGLFAAAMLLFGAIAADTLPGWLDGSARIDLAFSLLLGIGVPLIALSRERTEDEMIAQLRIRTVTQTAYAVLIAFCAWSIATAATPLLAAGSDSLWSRLLHELSPAWRVSTIFLCYILFFHFRLWRLKRSAVQEE